MTISGAYGYDVRPVKQDGDIDSRAQKDGFMRLDDAMEAARLLSGRLHDGHLVYRTVQVKDADTGWICAEFAHGDRLTRDHRKSAARPDHGPETAYVQIAVMSGREAGLRRLEGKPGTTGEAVTEYAQLDGNGVFLVWDVTPEGEQRLPLAKRIKSAREFGGIIFRRRVIVVESWEEVTEP